MALSTAELHHAQQRIKEQLLYLQHSPRNRALVLQRWLERLLESAQPGRARSFILEATAELFEQIPSLRAIGCSPAFVSRLRDVVRRAHAAVPAAFSAEDVSRVDSCLVHLERSIHAWLGEAGLPDGAMLETQDARSERERLDEYIAGIEKHDALRAADFRAIAEEWDAALRPSSDSICFPLLEHDLTGGEIQEFLPFGAVGQLHIHMRAVEGHSREDTLHLIDASQTSPETRDELTAALAAFRGTLVQFDRNTEQRGLHVDVSSSNGDIRLVGRSLGLAAAVGMLAAWSEECGRRHHVQVRPGVLVTGRVTRDGGTLALDAEHIPQKVELLHYSPFRALVLPKANESDAQERLDALQAVHAGRHARLYPARELADVVNSRAVLDIRTRSVAERAVREVRKHAPVLLIVSTALLLCTVAAWYIFAVDTDTNPHNITLMKNEFVVRNKNGKELWRAPAGQPSLPLGLEKEDAGILVDTTYARCMDLDGDGRSEVLACMYGISRGLTEWLTCYNSDGTVRWNKDLFFGIRTREGDYRNDAVTVTQLWTGYLHAHGPKVIIADAAKNYYPHALTVLDIRSGILARYYNIGAVRNYIVVPPRHGRNGKIVIAGQHNGFQSAILAVLDPDSIDGTCPQTATHELLWPALRRNREDAYLLIPKTRLARVVGDMRDPHALISSRTDSTITIRLNTVIIPDNVPSCPGEWAWIEFDVDWSLRPVDMRTSSEYDTYKAYVMKQKRWPTGDEKKEFLRGLRYWDGRTFIEGAAWRAKRPGYTIQ